MSEKERIIKKEYADEANKDAAEHCDMTSFADELCEGCKKINYCIQSNCANCEFRTKCTYVYESF